MSILTEMDHEYGAFHFAALTDASKLKLFRQMFVDIGTEHPLRELIDIAKLLWLYQVKILLVRPFFCCCCCCCHHIYFRFLPPLLP